MNAKLSTQQTLLREAEESLAIEWTLKASQQKVSAMYRIGKLNQKINDKGQLENNSRIVNVGKGNEDESA